MQWFYGLDGVFQAPTHADFEWAVACYNVLWLTGSRGWLQNPDRSRGVGWRARSGLSTKLTTYDVKEE